jgi:3',5'-cyclic AMP phosphodiesterase CpdA
VAVAAALGVTYRRQIVSYLTHWKGPPAHTEPYVAFAAPPDLRIAVAGDVGEPGRRLQATAAAMAGVNDEPTFDVLLLLGDNVYPSGDPARLPETVFGPFGPVLDQGAELLAILGNHDVAHADAQLAALGMPGRWWAVERDDVLLIGLDTNTPEDPSQLDWLKDTLRRTDARWRIVAMHHPPYSAGYQGSNRRAREIFSPVFERYGVQLVLSGHDHDYQRSHVIRGVTYIVTGAASDTRRTGSEGFTAESFSTPGFVELGIYRDRIEGRSVDAAGRIADVWVQVAAGPPSTSWRSASALAGSVGTPKADELVATWSAAVVLHRAPHLIGSLQGAPGWMDVMEVQERQRRSAAAAKTPSGS